MLEETLLRYSFGRIIASELGGTGASEAQVKRPNALLAKKNPDSILPHKASGLVMLLISLFGLQHYPRRPTMARVLGLQQVVPVGDHGHEGTHPSSFASLRTGPYPFHFARFIR